jgi:LysM domain
MAAPQSSGGGGNILTQRLGPLATWVWLLIATLVVGAVALYLRHKQGGAGKTPAAQAQPGEVTGAQNVPDIVLQNYVQQQQSETQSQTATQTAPPPTPAPPPAPSPKPTPKPSPGLGSSGKQNAYLPPGKKPSYVTVTVARYQGRNTPWNGTLSGIAAHYHVKGGYQALAKLNGIKNPNRITPGQKIKVPT